MNDVNRLRILQDVIDRRLTTRLAATRLTETADGCWSAIVNMGRFHLLTVAVASLLMPGLAERALRIIRGRYDDFGPTLACEKLAEVHGLYLAKETVRKLRRTSCSWAPLV